MHVKVRRNEINGKEFEVIPANMPLVQNKTFVSNAHSKWLYGRRCVAAFHPDILVRSRKVEIDRIQCDEKRNSFSSQKIKMSSTKQ